MAWIQRSQGQRFDYRHQLSLLHCITPSQTDPAQPPTNGCGNGITIANGRNCGYLALIAGVTGGAEVTVIPEVETDPEEVARELRAAYERGKAHAIAVVAEGARYNAQALSAYFQGAQGTVGNLSCA